MNPHLSASDIPAGFTFAATHCGIKRSRLDLGILISDTPAPTAAVFTTNQIVAAPVIASREHLRKSHGQMRGIIVNSGNANCCTKEDGYPASISMAEKLAAELGSTDPAQVIVCSTGVIGAPLRVEKIIAAVPHIVLARSAEPGAFEEFARSIMTTDTRPKWAAAKCRVGGKQVRLLGCAKGSGMIEPNMATMLAFIATDAAITAPLLDRALRACVSRTFNSITVDGDTSTNDTVAVLANGHSGAREIRGASGTDYKSFVAALEKICKSLALAIIEDGEGAQRDHRNRSPGRRFGTRRRPNCQNNRQFAAGENRFRRSRSQLGPHPRRRGPLRSEIRFEKGEYLHRRRRTSAATARSTHSTNAPSTKKCWPNTCPSGSTCTPAKPTPASGPATSPWNTSTSIRATGLRVRYFSRAIANENRCGSRLCQDLDSTKEDRLRCLSSLRRLLPLPIRVLFPQFELQKLPHRSPRNLARKNERIG